MSVSAMTLDLEQELLAELHRTDPLHVSPAVACFDLVCDVDITFDPACILQLLRLPKIFSFECYVDVPPGWKQPAKTLLVCLAVLWPCRLEEARVDFQHDQRPALLFLAALRHVMSLSCGQDRAFLQHFRRVTGHVLQSPLV